MAKRTIIECDLTKQEIEDEDAVFTLKIAKKGKRSTMTYELSATAAEKLLAQLNGRNELDDNWSFANGNDRQPESSGRRPRRTLGDLEDEYEEEEEPASDARRVAEKKAELREAGIIVEEAEPVATPVSDDGCRHINKGRIQTTMRKGKRYAYRKCKDCGTSISEKTAGQKERYMSNKLSGDIRIRDLDL